MSSVYKEVNNFLKDFDDYNTEKSFEADQHFQARPQQLVPAINSVVELHKVIETITSSYSDVPEGGSSAIAWYTTMLSKIFSSMNYFSSN